MAKTCRLTAIFVAILVFSEMLCISKAIIFILFICFSVNLFLSFLFFKARKGKREDVGCVMIILNLLEQSLRRHVFNRMNALLQALDCIVSLLLIWGGCKWRMGYQKVPHE